MLYLEQVDSISSLKKITSVIKPILLASLPRVVLDQYNQLLSHMYLLLNLIQLSSIALK